MAVNEMMIGIEPQIELAQILDVSPTAVNTIRMLLEQRNIPGYALRVFVSGGGCSGMQYGMSFEPAPSDFDAVVDAADGVRLVIDPTSMMYLQGATIDYVDSLMGGGFRIENPNSVSSCGCGSSFKSKDGAEAASSDAGCGSCSH